ncbi:MAG: hypothetical protein LAP85_13920 [Acidobacteriia bacterium]|nr:hypothetical protein [Terriglobia bacterium]
MRPHHISCILIFAVGFLFKPVIAGVTPQSRSITFNGRIQAAEVDQFDEAAGVWKHKRVLLLNTAGGELLELERAPVELARAGLGRQVRVSGSLQKQKLVVEHFEPVESPEATAAHALLQPTQQVPLASDTLGGQKTLVALFNFTDVQTRPFTLDSIKDKVLYAAKSTDSFLRENSYGKLWLDVDFVDWRTLPAISTQICPGST